ncbi:DNA cytosine methyltransferase [Tateyamaria sp.]|uniref:DNA cytosine methyltransferase n=1 Tax=Tateyamaria sp. TaxID=1929288 RepID=UPI003B2212C4
MDLFSGIGGFSLGLERTGGFETVAFCEIEPFPRAVLKKHWPEVPCYNDATTLTADILERDGISVDVITGGFPCQDLSAAGKRGGIEAERSGLWSEIVRLIGELAPKFVIIENVADLLVGPSEQPGGWFSKVLTDLAQCGYDAEWENIPVAALGGMHVRERVWLVAYPDQDGFQGLRPISQFYPEAGPRLPKQKLQVHQKNYHGLCGSVWDANAGRVFGVVDGISSRPHRLAACGNAVIPQIPELIGHAILCAEGAA